MNGSHSHWLCEANAREARPLGFYKVHFLAGSLLAFMSKHLQPFLKWNSYEAASATRKRAPVVYSGCIWVKHDNIWVWYKLPVCDDPSMTLCPELKLAFQGCHVVACFLWYHQSIGRENGMHLFYVKYTVTRVENVMMPEEGVELLGA